MKPRIGGEGAARPLPHIAIDLSQAPLPGLRRRRAQAPRLDEVAAQRLAKRGMFPLDLGRQSSAGPGRKRVGLVIAHMRDRRVRIDRLRAAQRHRPVAAVALLPIERRAPAFRLHARPSRRKPEQRRPIAAVGHERHPFRIGDEPVREFIRFEQHAMARPLAVEAEPLAVMSDLDHAAIEFAVRGRRAVGPADRQRPRIPVGRTQGVLRKQMQDVGQQQFLMLLLVIAAEFDQFGDGGPRSSCMSEPIARSTWSR